MMKFSLRSFWISFSLNIISGIYQKLGDSANYNEILWPLNQ